jgi:hypothetical protein
MDDMLFYKWDINTKPRMACNQEKRNVNSGEHEEGTSLDGAWGGVWSC